MSDFFKELEDDIREERIFILWRKYGNYVIGLALAITISTAGVVLWKYLKHRSQIQAHISFSRAVDLMKQGKKEEALKAFQDLENDGGGYRKLAQLYQAALLKNPEEMYTKISQENKTDPALGKLPILLMAARSLNNAEALAALEPLTAPKNAWAPLSLELLALVDLKKGDDMMAAKRYIQILKEPHATSDEQMRAGMMVSQLDLPASFLQDALKEGQ